MTGRAKKRPPPDRWIFLDGEAPQIGSGRRGVYIESIGPKWARIRDAATGTPAKLKREVWDRIDRASAKREAKQEAWRAKCT